MGFFREVFPDLSKGFGSKESRISIFEQQPPQDRQRVLKRSEPMMIDRNRIHELGVYQNRQPWRAASAPVLIGAARGR